MSSDEELAGWLARNIKAPGDVVVFRGDQKHSYENPGDRTAVGYSVVLLAPPLR
jgi:hypothetical protein